MVSLFVTILLLVPGIVGIIIPVVPGIPYMWLVAFIFTIADRFHHISPLEIATLLILALCSVCIDHISGLVGARKAGASPAALKWGFIGALIGLFLLPPFGSFIGLFAGVFIAEIIRQRTQYEALRAATGSVMGALAGTLVNLGLGLLFMVLFIFFALR
jgi:uncharacterized protein YqgC (DUF456 family)